MTIEEQNTGIRPAHLIELDGMGLKLVPLGRDSTPIIPWTPIYEDPEYWTPEKLVQEAPKFNAVATVFGKTRIKDEKGPLYLYCLDIDSDKVYNILFRLQNSKRNEEYSLIPLMQERTFVVKTRKPNGFHIYWLSHRQHEPILASDCKSGYEFEIKGGKNSGHCTLPPSRHRNDPNFIYKSYGQLKLFVSDDLYDLLKTTLADCLRSKIERKEEKSHDGQTFELADSDVQMIAECIRPYYKKGRRHPLVFGLCGVLHKSNVSKDSVMAVIDSLAKDDGATDLRNARGTVEEVFGKNVNIVAGRKYLLGALTAAAEDNTTAKEILNKIFRIIGKGDPIQRLTHATMNEFTIKTMSDNEEVYLYDEEKGVYVPGQEWRIKELCQMMYPQITTRQIYEVINQIKRQTYTDRTSFDSNIDIINVQNGLLNIHTKELTCHSADYLSTVQLPLEYKPRTVCPNILRFFREVLRRSDIHVVIQMIGYCIYRSCEFEKAFMFFGGGANGKGVLIKLIEAFLGENNCAHRTLQDLDKNRFATADLHGKLVNTCADLKSLQLFETGNFKMIVSGDSIAAERKFGQPFNFRNYAKTIFSANEIPESADKTDAFYRRWRIFHFDKKFQNGKEDSRLIKRLTTADELSGLLNLALIGLNQLINAGGFHDTEVEQTRREYEENTNDVNAFLYQECVVDITNPEYSTLATDAYAAYVNFCIKKGTRPLDMNVFGKKLAARGIYNVRHREPGSREAYYDGLLLRKHIQEGNQELIFG